MRLIEHGVLTRLGKALVVALTVWALVFVAPDLYRVVVPFWSLGITVDGDGLVTRVSRSADATPPVAPGDRIDLRAMSCARPFGRPCRDLMAVVGGMGGLQYVTPHHPPVTLAVRHADGRTAEVRIVPQPPRPPPGVWARLALAADELLGFFFIFVAVVLVWQSPSAMTFGFFLYATWFNPGQYFVSYTLLQPYPLAVLVQETLQALIQAAGYAGLVLFAIRFPDNTADARWRRIEVPLAALAGSVILVLQLWSFANAFGLETGTITNAAYLAGYAVDLAVTAILFSRLAGKTPQTRQRLRWVFWGCAIGLTAFIFADSNEATTLWNPVWNALGVPGGPREAVLNVVFALNAAVAVAVFYAVRHHHVVNVSFVISRSATLLASWIVAGGALALVSLELEPHLERQLQGPVFILAVVLLTLTFEWLHERINRGFDHVFYPALHRAEKRLLVEGERIAEASAYELVDRALVEEPVRWFGVTSAAVFRLDGDAFVRRFAFRWDDGVNERLEAGCVLVVRAAERRRPFRVRGLDTCLDVFPSGDAAPAVVVPIRAHGELLALAFYGPHRSGDDLNGEELDVLRRFALDASRGYDRAEITTLRRRLADLIASPAPDAAARYPEARSTAKS